jgi:ribosomal protein S18 acetylase RimI-like enzyme
MAFSIQRVHALSDAQVRSLADLLIDTVAGDASVSFLHPLSPERALEFWRNVAHKVRTGTCVLLVAEDDEGLCGTVQLTLDQQENQPHIATVTKLLVHSRTRRQGLGNALMRSAEALALECGKTMLILNTPSEEAQRLYERMGWKRAGVFPRYSLSPRGDAWRDSTFFYRDLDATEAR